ADFDVIVIDNASTDRTAEVVRSRFPSVELLENPTNAGFAVAVNAAAEHARGDVILLLNPDAVISAEGVRVLADEARRPEVGVVGGAARPRCSRPPARTPSPPTSSAAPRSLLHR